MTAVFGWMDHDESQRAAMNELVKMFQDKGSVDELGIGPIRDAFSNHFFPGTSVLHTRARYLLFVPWLLRESTSRGRGAEQAVRDLKTNEVKLIRSLLAGQETSGVIGSQAQERLKTMPSQVYWPALQRFRIVRWSLGVNAHLRRAASQTREQDITDGDAADVAGRDTGLDASLPTAPDDLLTSATFDLTADEASYLQSVFASMPAGSLMSLMAAQPQDATGERIWASPAMEHLPERARWEVDQARRLHHAWHGAPLLYNLMLAEATGDEILQEEYRDHIAQWQIELDDHQVFRGWDHSEFWTLIRTLNPRLRPSTQTFVSSWLHLAQSGEGVSAAARTLVRDREIFLKNRRSRLVDARARESWTPGAGTGRLGYRWGIAAGFLSDVQAGLVSTDTAQGAA